MTVKGRGYIMNITIIGIVCACLVTVCGIIVGCFQKSVLIGALQVLVALFLVCGTYLIPATAWNAIGVTLVGIGILLEVVAVILTLRKIAKQKNVKYM